MCIRGISCTLQKFETMELSSLTVIADHSSETKLTDTKICTALVYTSTTVEARIGIAMVLSYRGRTGEH